MEQDPDIVFVTGWNEWIAMRLVRCPAESQSCLLRLPTSTTAGTRAYEGRLRR